MAQRRGKRGFVDTRPGAPEADRALVAALRGRGGKLTLADAVAASGLAMEAAEQSLERLLRTYRSHLAVTETGELLYSFDPDFRRRDEPSLRERAAKLGRALLRAGVAVFKAFITVTLIVYVVVFVVLLLGLAMGGRRGGRRSHGLGMGGLWWVLWPDWGRGVPRDQWGRRLVPHEELAPGRPRKRFLESVFDFVFGPARKPRDPREDEREALAYIRAHKGRIVATDLVRLFAWSYGRADDEATRLLVSYGGEPQVTEDGVIVYAFPDLLKTAGEGIEIRYREAWQRLEERPPLTGNTPGRDLLIGGLAAFNLLASLVAADLAREAYGLAGPGWEAALTGFPLAFFSLFLAVPAARAVARRVADRSRARRNRRRLVVRQIVAERGAALPDAPDMKALALEFEGEPDLEDETRVVWRFPRVREELDALEALLPGVDLAGERAIGPVIFSSDDDAGALGAGEAKPDALPE